MMKIKSVFNLYLYFKLFKKNCIMDFKKLAGQILVVTAGVAVYMLAVKPLLDKAKIGG